MSLRDYFSNNKIFTGTEKPTQGKFDVGDIIVNIGPNSAEEPMWICVEAGTPGVWELCSGVNEEEIADMIQANALSAIDYTDGVDIQIDGGEIGNMNELQTTDKSSIVGAINELFQSANNGKELIANAIGEPLNSEDTFSAMSGDINSLLSTFKTNMMNSGVTVESGDKFKALIDKIKGLTEGEGNKGIQFAEGTCNISCARNIVTNIPFNIDFTPTYLFLYVSSTIGFEINLKDLIISNLTEFSTISGYSIFVENITQNGCDIRMDSITPAERTLNITKWLAIGVGEEDTTLRDSLASILEDEGVDVTEEDDMASLISKVDSEFEKDNDAKDRLYDLMLEGGYDVNNGMTIDDLLGLLELSGIYVDEIKQIACGQSHTFILKNDGSVWSCGYNGNGQLGLGDSTDRTTFTQVTTNINNDVTQIDCGTHTFILKTDGSVWACGYNNNGQLGLGNTTDYKSFTSIPKGFTY